MKLFEAVSGAVIGSVGIVSMFSYLLDVLPAPYNSVVFGGGVGLFAATAVAGVNVSRNTSSPIGSVGELPGVSGDSRGGARKGQGKTLDKAQLLRKYDRAFAQVITLDGAESRSEALERLKPILYELSPDIKAWSGDARLRAFLLMQAVAKDLENPSLTSASLSLIVMILSKGGTCAVEMAKPIFGEKIRKMYDDPKYKKERFLPRLLLELGDYDSQQVESLAKDAIHVWGDEQFAAASEYLGFDELRQRPLRNKLKGILGAEIANAGFDKDRTALNRAIELYHVVK